MTNKNFVLFDTFIPAWDPAYPQLNFFERKKITYLRYADGEPYGGGDNTGEWDDLLPDKVGFERYPPGGHKGPPTPGLRRRSAEMVRVLELNDGPVRARLERLSVSKANWNGATPEGQRTREAIKSLFHAIDELEFLAFWILVEDVPPNVALGVVQHFEGLEAHRLSALSKTRGRESLGARIARTFGTRRLLPMVEQVAIMLKKAKADAKKNRRNTKWERLQAEQLTAAIKFRVPVTPEELMAALGEEPKRAACQIVAERSGGLVHADDLYNGEARFRGKDAAPRSPRKKATRTTK